MPRTRTKAAPPSISKTFNRERETKNTVVYVEDRNDDAKPTSYYMPKEDDAALGSPDSITLTVAV